MAATKQAKQKRKGKATSTKMETPNIRLQEHFQNSLSEDLSSLLTEYDELQLSNLIGRIHQTAETIGYIGKQAGKRVRIHVMVRVIAI